MMDYSFCFGIDLIITMLIIFMLVLGIYVFRNGPIMSGIIATLTGIIVVYMAMTTLYEDVLQQDAAAYRYKIAIEENLDDGFSQHFTKSWMMMVAPLLSIPSRMQTWCEVNWVYSTVMERRIRNSITSDCIWTRYSDFTSCR